MIDLGLAQKPEVKLLRRLGVVAPAVLQEVETALKVWLKLP
jgi:hypothetical protein